MAGITAILITKNEEKNLRGCLTSLVDVVDEIVVVDSGSVDTTVEVAREFGARVTVCSNWQGFGVQKNRALQLATKEWILSIDADERLSVNLKSEILRAINEEGAYCYAFPRKSWYCGRLIRFSGWRPDYVVRLFKRDTARFSTDLVHERLLANLPIKKLKSPMLHYSFRNFSQVLEKVDAYSSASSEQLFASGKDGGVVQALMHGLWTFLRTYIFKLGFLDGAHGLALAISNAEGSYYRYLKLWHMHLEKKANED